MIIVPEPSFLRELSKDSTPKFNFLLVVGATCHELRAIIWKPTIQPVIISARDAEFNMLQLTGSVGVSERHTRYSFTNLFEIKLYKL